MWPQCSDDLRVREQECELLPAKSLDQGVFAEEYPERPGDRLERPVLGQVPERVGGPLKWSMSTRARASGARVRTARATSAAASRSQVSALSSPVLASMRRRSPAGRGGRSVAAASGRAGRING
jgi:hypothetical protein